MHLMVRDCWFYICYSQKRNTSSLPVLPHQRLRRKAALEHSPAWLKRSKRYLRDCDRCVISLWVTLNTQSHTPFSLILLFIELLMHSFFWTHLYGFRQRPLMQWMYHCRWIILVIYLTVLCSIIILAILVWLLQTPVLWMWKSIINIHRNKNGMIC